MSIKIMNWVWENSTETGTNLLMLLAIADHANDDGVCWPSIARLAARARVKERQAQNIVKQLEESGSIEVQRGVGRKHTSLYIVKGAEDCTFSKPEKVQRNAPIDDRKGAIQREKVQSSVVKGAIAIAPEPLEPSIEPGTTPAPQQVVQTNGYFGMPKPMRRERVIADGYTQDAAKKGVDAPTYVAIFNELIDIAGWRALVDAGDDSKLNYAKRDALLLIDIGHKTPEHIRLLADAYMKANTWRESPPLPKDLATYASQLQAGVLREGKKESKPGANREIINVRFAKPGDDIYA
jgi:hypothetical protein